MTQTQKDYQQLMESRRHNMAMEAIDDSYKTRDIANKEYQTYLQAVELDYLGPSKKAANIGAALKGVGSLFKDIFGAVGSMAKLFG